MNPFAPSNVSGGGSNPFGTSATGSTDLNSSEGLLALAQQQGGALSQVANELVHPQTSILSTIGNGFKKAFSGFVDLISVPNQVVAGILSDKYSISDAVKKNISTSDVIFGEREKNASTMHKVGSFLVRTATDILFDPLTYLTFGAGQGIVGLRSLPKVTLGEKTAALLGKETLSAGALSPEGFELYKYLNAVKDQSNGLTKAAEIMQRFKGAPLEEAFAMGSKELETLLAGTIDAPLNIDFAKKAITNLLEAKPALAETLLDKGGIKFFGQSILSGQRVSAAVKMIPGMTFLDDITMPARRGIQALFDPSLEKVNGQYVRLPQEYLDLEMGAKNLAESMQDSRLTNLSNIVKANKLDSNEGKLLMAAVEAGKMPSDERLANAFKQLMQFSEDDFKYLKESGVPISRLDNHAPHVLVKTKVTNVPFTLPVTSKVGAAFERTMDSPIWKDVEAGIKNSGMEIFDDNIVSAHAVRTMQNMKSGTMRGFVRDVAISFGQPESIAPQGWVKIDSKAIKNESEFVLKALGKDGEELMFHPAIAKRIENFAGKVLNDEATSDFLRSFDSIQNLWKAGVTSIFPSFHGRNAISNVFLHYLDLGVHSINPVNHTVATQLVYHDRVANKLEAAAFGIGEAADAAKNELHDLITKKMFTDALGHEWTFGELRQTMKNNGVAFTKNITGSIDVTKSANELANSLFPDTLGKAGKIKQVAGKILPTSQEFAPFKMGREVGRAIEEQARVLDFVANLKNTGDVSHAAARTKQFLFDYSNLTNFEKTFLKRVIPFYTFTRKNLELQVKTLMTTPGRISAELAGLTNLGEAISGGNLSPEEYDALPDWIKSGIGILKSKNGSKITMFGSLGTPIEQPFNAFQPNQFLGSVSPLLRVPIEQATGYSWFQGKPLSDITNAAGFKNAPQAVKNFIGYKVITGKRKDGTPFTYTMSMRPERMNIVNNLPLVGRVLSSLKQMDNVDVDTQDKILQQLIGVRPYAFDIEQEQQKKEIALQAELKALLTKAGVTAQFTRTYVPKPK